MLKQIISALGYIDVLLMIAVGVVAGYHNTMYINEWLGDHAKSADFGRRQLLSVVALFLDSATERGRRRRRQVLIWNSAAASLFVVEILILWWLRSNLNSG